MKFHQLKHDFHGIGTTRTVLNRKTVRTSFDSSASLSHAGTWFAFLLSPRRSLAIADSRDYGEPTVGAKTHRSNNGS
jgi:hypothetical protein